MIATKKLKKVQPKPRTERIKQVAAEPKIDELELVRITTRESFRAFVRYFWSSVSEERLQWNWHMGVLCDEMQKVAELIFAGKDKEYDLVVNISPGTSKSSIMSVLFPMWCWTRMPHFKMIGASYVEEAAMDLNNKSRQLVSKEVDENTGRLPDGKFGFRKVFPEIEIRADMDAKGKFGNTKGGWRMGVGVKGKVTSWHAHAIVIDDPLSPEQAESDADIATSNRWIDTTLSSRKVSKTGSPMILVMQRIHHNDPTALFLRRKKVRHICLPAELPKPGEEDNVCPPELKKYYKDGLMDPTRLSHAALEEARERGDRYYATQFLQKPAPEGGEMFLTNRLKYIDTPPGGFTRVVRFWDKAGTKGGGAFTVGTLMGVVDDQFTKSRRYFVLDVVRRQVDSFFREQLIVDTAEADGTNVIIGIEQEPGSGGKESAENTAGRLEGYRVRIVKVDISTGGKVQRADPFSSQVNAGNVYVVKAPWNEQWVEELKYFPHSTFKDQVDSASGAFHLLWRKKKRIGGMKKNQVKVLKVGGPQ